MEKSYLLGISAGYHDSAAAIVVDGEVKKSNSNSFYEGDSRFIDTDYL